MQLPNQKIFVAAVGDSNSIVTWSGIPYHLLQAGIEIGCFHGGLPLETTSFHWRWRRALWNLYRPLLLDRFGGYQYSVAFLEQLWAGVRDDMHGRVVINCFQLYPPSVMADPTIARWYFLDQTLLQLFDYYEVRPTIGKRIAREALRRERDGYASATGIIMHSAWAAASVIDYYGISEEKVHVVVPGANLDPSAYQNGEKQQHSGIGRRSGPLRLVFVGKDPQRKGLDRLIRAFKIARDDGAYCSLRIIGCELSNMAVDPGDIDGIEWLGFVDKRNDSERYLGLVAECDVGCLLSRAEAGGIGLREYQALGLAVFGPDTGGSPDHVLREASVLVKPEESDEMIASKLIELAMNPEKLERMKQHAWKHRHVMLWASSVKRIMEILGLPERSKREGMR